MLNPGMMSSESSEWGTPQWFFDVLDREFHFTIDVCASKYNHKLSTYWTKEQDCLSRPWVGYQAFMNPVYGEPEQICKPNCQRKMCQKRGYHNTTYRPGIIDFMRQAYEACVKQGVLVVCLIPSRTDTLWWHKYVMFASEVRFVRGRLKFEGVNGTKNAAPFPSAVCIFRPEDANHIARCSNFGMMSNKFSDYGVGRL